MRSIAIVIPVYNEAENIILLYNAICKNMGNENFTFYFVDDGSQDGSIDVLKLLSKQDSRVHYISFTRNFGHQYAIKAGIDHATGDCIITMDGDMQHPPELLPILLGKWRDGYAIVQTIRSELATNSNFKKITSQIFYKLINFLTPIEIKNGSADFRLLDKKVVEYCKQLHETSYFWRGIIPWTGFSSIEVEYTPHSRAFGYSKYTLRKMLRLATDGIFSFSLVPLRVCIGVGMFSMCMGLVYLLYVLFTLFAGSAISGWASIVSCILFFSGVQLVFLGILGEYLGRIFIAGKQRPDYIINEQK